MVEVKLYTLLFTAAGEHGYESSAPDVESLLEEVRERYGDGISRYLEGSIVLVNGKNIGYLSGKKTRLHDGDVVSLFPPVAGG